MDQKKNFKLEEEGMPALLLLLPKLVAETADFSSASGSGCRLVVATVQAIEDKTAISAQLYSKGQKKNLGAYPSHSEDPLPSIGPVHTTDIRIQI